MMSIRINTEMKFDFFCNAKDGCRSEDFPFRSIMQDNNILDFISVNHQRASREQGCVVEGFLGRRPTLRL